MLATSRCFVLGAILVLAGCSTPFDPASYLTGLRVLAVKADPPEVAAGTPTTLSVLAVDTEGSTPDVAWSACTEPAVPGFGAINPDCFGSGPASYLVALGSGLSLVATMPQVALDDFGPPDASGGLYLPIILRAETAGARVQSAFRMRLGQGTTPNRNPTLTAVLMIPSDGSAPIPLDELSPLEVRPGDHIAIRAVFSDDSAEVYNTTVPGQPSSASEILRVSWFSTAGSWSEPTTGQAEPDTIWRADDHLPPSNSSIEIYVVGRDDRGGTDYLHRTFVLR